MQGVFGTKRWMVAQLARLTQWQYEWHVTTPSGAVKRLSSYGHPEALPDGGIRWDVVVRDVTQEVHARRTAS